MASAFRSFGPEAEQWAQRFTIDVPGIAADASDPARALEAAVLARMRGELQYVALLIDEPRAAVAVNLAVPILAQTADIDLRRNAFDQLADGTLELGAGRTSGSFPSMDDPVRRTLRHLYDLADVLVVRSWAERDRLSRLFGGFRPSVWRCAPPDPSVPSPSGSGGGRRDAIVVWAPKRWAQEAAFFAFAFHEMDLDVVVLCAGGDVRPLGKVRFVDARGPDARSLLERALVIIDAELSDPGTAMALTSYGVPLAVTSTSGAREFVDPAYTYEPSNWRSLHKAGMTALGGRPSVIVARGDDIPAPMPTSFAFFSAPLVSVVIPTYNRRAILAHALELWSQQRYPNYEIVLVNDAGESIGDIAARFPRVRLIDLEANGGHPAAVHRGVGEARGEYLIIADDDDEYAPDHIEGLVCAMERCGAAVAHTNVIIRHEEGHAGGHRIVGYSLTFNQSMDRTTVLSGGITVLQGMMIRRSAYGAPCWFDPSIPVGRDYAMILELALRHDFIHVDTSSAMYCLRAQDPSSMRRDLRLREAEGLRMIYDRHPTPERPVIEDLRRRAIAFNEETGSDMYVAPAIRLPE
jgi:hypothetical protein